MIQDVQLPEIRIVRHIRAKKLRLVVSDKGIRLTVPFFTSRRQIQSFVEQHEVWLQQTWAKYQQKIDLPKVCTLPDTLSLCYSDNIIKIQIAPLKKKFVFDAEHQTLLVNEQYAAWALTQFVCQQAKSILSEKVMLYAAEHDLRVNSVRIATPTTRWGSCSGDQRIMLHAGLLLMPENFADYVILHELAHTRHMNHQAGFWQLLEQFYPNAKQTQKEMRMFRLPTWWQTKQ